MKCPKCLTELTKKMVHSIEVDECQACNGTWYDKDELREAKDLEDSDLNWMDFEIWKHKDRFKGGQAGHACPKCDVLLKMKLVPIEGGLHQTE